MRQVIPSFYLCIFKHFVIITASAHLSTGWDDVHIDYDLDTHRTNAGQSPEMTQMLDNKIVMNTDHNAAWKQYNTIMFGPDIVLASTASLSATDLSILQPKSSASSSMAIGTDSLSTLESGRQITPVTKSDLVTSSLLSSRKSFSNLNIYPSSCEDPYGAAVLMVTLALSSAQNTNIKKFHTVTILK